MAFFQDLGKKISNAASDASKKTSEMIEISKLNSSINGEKSSISEIQKKIGAMVYDLYASGEQLPEILTADLQIIAEKNQNITGFENKIAEIKADAEKHKEEAAAAAAAAQEQYQQQQAEAAAAAAAAQDRYQQQQAEAAAAVTAQEQYQQQQAEAATAAATPQQQYQQQYQQQQAEAVSQPAEPQPSVLKTEEPQAPPADRKRFCIGCGAPLLPNMLYCGTCGTKNDL